MPFDDVLAHRATPLRNISRGTVVEGQRVTGPTPGTPFDCAMFLPQGQKSPEGRGRRVREPIVLYAVEDDLGAEVALRAQDELLVVAPEHNLAMGFPSDREIRWRLAGDPQPLGKPGEEPIGFQVTVVLVED